MEIELDKIKNVKLWGCVKILESTKSQNPTGSQQAGPASFIWDFPRSFSASLQSLFTIPKYLLFRAPIFFFSEKGMSVFDFVFSHIIFIARCLSFASLKNI